MKRYQVQRRSSVRPQWAHVHDMHNEEFARQFLASVRADVSVRSHARLNVEYRLIDSAPFGMMTELVSPNGLVLD